MNARAFLKVDKATFYKFLERQAEGRFEFDRGRIVQHMTGGTFAHTKIAQRLVSYLEGQLDPNRWFVSSHNRGVETPETVRYPDVVLEHADAPLLELSTDKPVLIVEVLSPTTAELDLNTKPAEYMSLPSLLAYVVASQDGPELTLWLRRPDGTFADEPAELKGLEQSLAIDALGIVIPLAEIYRGVGNT